MARGTAVVAPEGGREGGRMEGGREEEREGGYPSCVNKVAVFTIPYYLRKTIFTLIQYHACTS